MLVALRRRKPVELLRIRRSHAGYPRFNSTTSSDSPSQLQPTEASLFIDSVFPVKLGTWDIRHYLGLFRQETLLDSLHEVLNDVQTHGFKVIDLKPRNKDGGVFVKFTYYQQTGDDALKDILEEVRNASSKKGGLPTWTGLSQISGDIWPVKGKPWLEDLHRYASPMLKVSFDGPDIREETLYDIFRPFGRITEISPPAPGSNGALRYSIVTFRQLRSCATAHNCIHGLAIPASPGSGVTRLRTAYERPLKAHAIRDWITGHPKIVLPILVFLIGSITYTVFDPLRIFAVEGKLLNWFDYKSSPIYQWLKRNTVERLSFALSSRSDHSDSATNVWKERKDAEEEVVAYLRDFPSTVTFVYGPQGSGKSSMLFSVLKENERPTLVIDCSELYKSSSDSALLSSIARQTGYWPVFPFVNSLNNIVDIASVGLIGQKVGLNASITDQVKQILEVVGTGLKRASVHELKRAQDTVNATQEHKLRQYEEKERRAALHRATWHDPRLDCVAGNGIMSELGVGDELMRPNDYDIQPEADQNTVSIDEKGDRDVPKTTTEIQALQALPIVIIKNFATKRGKDDVLDVLANWAASLVNSKAAHVLVMSDNRENAKVIARALPSKPLHTVALSDADNKSALYFVEKKLKDSGKVEDLSSEQKNSITRLGGRASDLETLVHKVNNGLTIDEAVEDIISRGLNELRKAAFGEDVDDAKTLPWSREQAWVVLKRLAKADEIAYHDLLHDFPFKGDESALRSMEHAELIAIGTQNGRPSTIKPGKPVYRYVFERLAADPVFHAIQELSSNSKRIVTAEATVKACEDELKELASISDARSSWIGRRSATSARASYLLKKMHAAENTLEKLEAANVELKKVLAKTK